MQISPAERDRLAATIDAAFDERAAPQVVCHVWNLVVIDGDRWRDTVGGFHGTFESSGLTTEAT